MDFETFSVTTGYQGFFRIDIHELQHDLFAGGKSATLRRELFERGNAVAVLIHDPETDGVLVVEQFRIGAIRDADGPWLMEIVAGIIEPGESKAGVARREAQEEAGCVVTELKHIIDYYPSPGGSTEIISVYYAPMDLSGFETSLQGLDHEGEDIRVSVVSLDELMAQLELGKIKSSMMIIALQWLALRNANYS